MIQPSDIVAELINKLTETGLANVPGALLYSDIATLASGKIYVLGYNPGGNPVDESDSVAVHLTKHAERSNWNEYIDGEWTPGGHGCKAGEASMQKRVCHLIASLGLSVREVCASNLIFVRSRVSGHLINPKQLAERCWPVHQFILEHVAPKAILSIGGAPVFEFIRKHGQLISEPEPFLAGHGNWGCLAARVQLGAREMALVSVPHLGRYAIDKHPDVISWVKSKLAL